ncbi:helix-turn-helix domain-containing protein [Paenibacillus sp. GCM10027626]|uniref:helix-turn-helix domain-containing protein n=1 Tax=Paenibacillus sp. GCM10027626 TaxID=3273411 RepID=UPI00362E9F7D
MIMRPTVIERNILTGSAAHEYMKKMVEMDQLVTAALVKNLLFTVKGAEKYSKIWKEEDLFNKEMLVEYAFKLLQHISEESARDNTPTFSTTEVAKYIGVSPQTINTWLREGKIIGVEKEGKKWSRIPGDAEVVFTNGKQVSIATLKANWETENEEPKVDEITYLEHSIKELEEKYGGPFEEVFGDKTIKELTEEDTDASIWWSYKARLASAKVSWHK